MNLDPQFILNSVAQTIFDKKGFNILVIDVRDVSTLTDYFVIAEGSADRHVQAIASSVVDTLKNLGAAPTHVEGKNSGDWIVIDDFNIIVHLFMPGIRDLYGLEELWRDGKIVDVAIQTGNTSK
ncbi:MAG: ribosome silencing factor [Chlamydiales bacterium]|nr:ribosome silencing factor [Chlamydiales bacterium]